MFWKVSKTHHNAVMKQASNKETFKTFGKIFKTDHDPVMKQGNSRLGSNYPNYQGPGKLICSQALLPMENPARRVASLSQHPEGSSIEKENFMRRCSPQASPAIAAFPAFALKGDHRDPCNTTCVVERVAGRQCRGENACQKKRYESRTAPHCLASNGFARVPI